MAGYSKEDLDRLHRELISILKEIIRVCEVLDIKYFIIGGTAIGAYFNKGIVPWDDDIDIGMARDQYERFIREAPDVISDRFFVQCFETEPKTPFFFMKVRKNGTVFKQWQYRDMDIHHGIYVDVFPFDHVPDRHFMEVLQRRLVQYLEGRFMRRQVEESIVESLGGLPSPVIRPLACIWRMVIKLLPRRYCYNSVQRVSAWFNKKPCRYISLVKMPRDHIAVESLENPVMMPFENLEVVAPSDIEVYLKHHYPWLTPVPPKDKQVNHAPYELKFSTDTEPGRNISTAR